MATRNKPTNPEEEGGKDEGRTGSDPTPDSKSRPVYLEAALRVSSSKPLGAPLTDTNFLRSSSDVTISTGKPGATGTPGICTYDYISTYGVSRTNTSALNRAVFNDFNVIRSQISGNRNYEPADHMIYRIAIDSLRELYVYVRRIYGIVRTYSATNLYRPRATLESMGLDADSWITNAAALYQWLLTYQDSLRPFPTIPVGDMSVNHIAFDTYLFKDGDIEAAQTYILNHRYYYSYEVVDQVKGLTIVEMANTYPEFLKMWDRMYSALQNSADVYIIAADIRRAFGDKVIVDLPDTDVNYRVEYVEYATAKESIMNACVLGINNAENYMQAMNNFFRVYDNGAGGLNVADEPDILNFNTAAGLTTTPMMLNHINCLDAEPSADSILHSVRLKPAMGVEVMETQAHLSVRVELIAIGSEAIISARMVGVDANGNYSVQSAPTGFALMKWSDGYNVTSVTNVLRSLSYVGNFDWHHPIIVWGVDYDHPEDVTTLFYMFEDIQNYVPVTDQDLKMIHEAKLLSDFGF